MAEGDRPAVHVHPVEVGAGLLLPGQHHAGEGLVDLEQVDVAEGDDALRSTFSVAGTTPVSISSGSEPVAAKLCRRASGRRPRRAAVSLDVISTAEAPSLTGLALPAVTFHSICGKRSAKAGS